MATVKVQALHTFADNTSVIGLRSKGEFFECEKKHAEMLNGIHDFALVDILGKTLEKLAEKPAKKRKKGASDSDSKAVSDEAAE